MSATEFVEQFCKLPPEEQRAVFEQIREIFDDELSPEQIAELEHRAADARAHPERCRPMEDVFEDIQKRYRAKK